VKIEAWLHANRKMVTLVLFGLLFLGVGVFLFRSGILDSTEVKVLGSETDPSASPAFDGASPGMTAEKQVVTVEISGNVLKPGVYQLEIGARVDDLLIKADGLSAAADRDWVAKNLNRAAKVSDGQKVYIPSKGNGGNKGTPSLTNLNSASLKELDALPGIGGTRAQSIITGRPFSSVEELLTRKILPKSVYEKVKGAIAAP